MAFLSQDLVDVSLALHLASQLSATHSDHFRIRMLAVISHGTISFLRFEGSILLAIPMVVVLLILIELGLGIQFMSASLLRILLNHKLVSISMLGLFLDSLVVSSSAVVSQRDLFIVRQVPNDVHAFRVDRRESWHVVGTRTTARITHVSCCSSSVCSGLVLHVGKGRGATCSLDSLATAEQLLRVAAKVE